MKTLSADNPVRRVLPLVGDTPLLDVRFHTTDGRHGRIFVKYEALNFTGSIKDRMATWILADAYERGTIGPTHEIVEASSGNTAISFAALGRALGHPVRIFMPDWMSHERKVILRSLGAILEEVSAAEGGFVGSIARAHDYAAAHKDVFEPLQFDSPANVRAHAEGTGPEILAQLDAVGLTVHAFVAGVGTGGTVMGVGEALRTRHPEVAIHPVQPAESPVLTTGHQTGHHRIQGISDEFVPSIVDLERLHHPLDVSDGDAILMAQKLASELGLGVGISSGANVVAAIRTQHQLGPDSIVTTILSDSNKKYLSTDLFRAEPSRPDYLTQTITFDRWSAIPVPV